MKESSGGARSERRSAKKGVSASLMANAVRCLSMDAVERAGSGHPGLPMGAADVATVLFTRHIHQDPRAPDWPNRDRFILSAGHGSMLLYALLYLLGYKGMRLKDLRDLRRLGSQTPGHPERGSGVEMTTGPLGQGLGSAVGIALGERLGRARWGEDLVGHYTYVLASDGDLMEGISHEACSLAGHLGLGKLIVLHDDNEVTIDGEKGLSDSDDVVKRFEALGWEAERVDGHDAEAVSGALDRAKASEKPSLISCRTQIGKGAPTKAGTAAAHGAALGADEVKGARKALGWKWKPFEVPAPVLDAWRLAGLRSGRGRRRWEDRLRELDEESRAEFSRCQAGDLPEGFDRAIRDLKSALLREKGAKATRSSSGAVVKALAGLLPEMVGGSADLTGSTQTRSSDQGVIQAGEKEGRFIHYGVREHGMAAIMNGLALYGGLIPYGGTFLVFSDYCRPSIRLAALMGLRVIYVFTHDSIGVGEDGPTHQPVEHLTALRAIPNLHVYRPADGVETAECWSAALRREGPSALILTRQAVPLIRTSEEDRVLSARGAYEVSGADGEASIVFLASGSEVSIGLEAQRLLESEKIAARVVSAPCLEAFEEQESSWREGVLGNKEVRIVIEAGEGMAWRRYMREGDVFIGMKGFGASGEGGALFEHFGITAKAAQAAAREATGRQKGGK